ncbi:MAG: hypothetical protein ACI8PZ_005874 [Myxococcota bacterium]|jgi:hypothetical protein
MRDASDPWATSDTTPAFPWEQWLGGAEPWMWVLVSLQTVFAVAALLGVASILRELPLVSAQSAVVRVGVPAALLLVPSAINLALSMGRSRLAWSLAAPHMPRSTAPVRLLRVGPLLWASMALLAAPGLMGLGAAGGVLPPGLLGWTPWVTLVLGGVLLPIGVLGWDGALARLLPSADHDDRLAFEAKWAGVVSWTAHLSWLVGADRMDEAARILAVFHRRSQLFAPSFLIPLGEWCMASGRPDAAVDVFSGARALLPADPRAHAGWAEARLLAAAVDDTVLVALDDATALAAGWRWRWNRPGWTTALACQRAWALATLGRHEGARLAIDTHRPALTGLGRLPRAAAHAALARAEHALGGDPGPDLAAVASLDPRGGVSRRLHAAGMG